MTATNDWQDWLTHRHTTEELHDAVLRLAAALDQLRAERDTALRFATEPAAPETYRAGSVEWTPADPIGEQSCPVREAHPSHAWAHPVPNALGLRVTEYARRVCPGVTAWPNVDPQSFLPDAVAPTVVREYGHPFRLLADRIADVRERCRVCGDVGCQRAGEPDHLTAAQAEPGEVTHLAPEAGGGLTRCCGRTPFELPRGDRMSVYAPVVTCKR